MKRAILTTVLAAAACAPASAHRAPGAPPAVHWPAAIKANVGQTETNLERDSGLNWEPLNKDALGRTVFGTVGASSAQADEAHAWLCGTEWGRDAVRMWASGGGKGCFTQPTGTSDSGTTGGANNRSASGIASFYTDRGTLAWSGRYRNSNGCASWTIPPGTVITIHRGDRTTTCVVDDRGPHPRLRRLIDLLPHHFDALGIKRSAGITQVTIEWSEP